MTTSTIYTIGHSTHSIEAFLAMLQFFEVKMVVDIRSLPGSRKFPQFDLDNLKISLEDVGITYQHMTDLGGRRKVKKDSKNMRWNNVSFRAYADYMETQEFESAIIALQKIALNQTIAFMCAEAVWWRCHRSMVSDYLKAKGWEVRHIMSLGKFQEHRFTAPARIVGEDVLYTDDDALEH